MISVNILRLFISQDCTHHGSHVNSYREGRDDLNQLSLFIYYSRPIALSSLFLLSEQRPNIQPCYEMLLFNIFKS